MEVAVTHVAGDGEEEVVFVEKFDEFGEEFWELGGGDDEVVDKGGGVFVANVFAKEVEGFSANGFVAIGGGGLFGFGGFETEFFNFGS